MGSRRPPSAVHLASGVAFAAAAVAAAAPPALAALTEPANALSLPTWTIHVSSVVEWVTAMALVWDYGERTGLMGWKGLSWGWFHFSVERCALARGISSIIQSLLRYL